MNTRIIKTMLVSMSLFLVVWTAQSEDVKVLWKKNCASCHGQDGRGNTPAGKKQGVVDLTDPKIQDKFTDEQMFKAVKEGIKDGNKTKMKPAERLSDREIKALIKHVRTLKK